MAIRNFSSTAADTTLTTPSVAADTTLDVAATTGFPAPPFILALEPDTANQEVVLVTGVAGLTLTVTRGYDSTVAVDHASGVVARHSHAAIDFREANTHANSTDGIHGVTGSVVGTSDTQTLTNKTLSVDSNTIDGIAASSFVVTDSLGKVDGSAAQKAVPSGAVVGTTDAQVVTNKTFDSSSPTAFIPSGAIWMYGGEAPPNGWLSCGGQAVSRDTYADLFAAIGTAYGAGDGASTFNVPNLKGRVPVGVDSTQSEFDVLGETGGAKTHVLTINEMPSHEHQLNRADGVGGSLFSIPKGDGAVATSGEGIGNEGGGQAHNNLQPYIALNFIIKA